MVQFYNQTFTQLGWVVVAHLCIEHSLQDFHTLMKPFFYPNESLETALTFETRRFVMSSEAPAWRQFMDLLGLAAAGIIHAWHLNAPIQNLSFPNPLTAYCSLTAWTYCSLGLKNCMKSEAWHIFLACQQLFVGVVVGVEGDAMMGVARISFPLCVDAKPRPSKVLLLSYSVLNMKFENQSSGTNDIGYCEEIISFSIRWQQYSAEDITIQDVVWILWQEVAKSENHTTF